MRKQPTHQCEKCAAAFVWSPGVLAPRPDAFTCEKCGGRLVPIKTEAEGITHVMCEKPCAQCNGTGRVPGGQTEYGEVISCPVCNGRKRVPVAVPLEDFRRLLAGPDPRP